MNGCIDCGIPTTLWEGLCFECRRERQYLIDEREAIQLEDVPFEVNPGRLGVTK